MSLDIQHSASDILSNAVLPNQEAVEIVTTSSQANATWVWGWLLLLIVATAACFVFYWVIKNFIAIRIKARSKRRSLNRLVFILEIISWSSLVVIYLYFILSIHFIVFGALLVLLIYFANSLIINLIYGIVFKIKNIFSIGDKIAVGDIEGEIKELKSFAVVVNNEEDDVVYVPYSKLKDQILIKQHSQGNIQSMSITMEVSELEASRLHKEGISWLNSCPWIIGRENISVKKNSENSISFSFQTVNIEFKKRIVDFLNDKMKN